MDTIFMNFKNSWTSVTPRQSFNLTDKIAFTLHGQI